MPTLHADADALTSRFRRVAFAVALPILATLALLTYREYALQHERELAVHDIVINEYVAKIEALVAAADAHVSAMRGAFTNAMTGPVAPRSTAPWRMDTTSDRPVSVTEQIAGIDPRYFCLTAIIPSMFSERAPGDRELAAALELPYIQAAAHTTQGYFQWSYYFSSRQDLVQIFPAADTDYMFGTDDPFSVFQSYFTYALYTDTTLGLNPNRSSIWAPVYFDAGGSGLMVSHTAPVDVAGKQVGMVGTDVLVKVTSEILSRPSNAPELLVLSDQAGNIIGDSKGMAASRSEITDAGSLLGVASSSLPVDAFTDIDNEYFFAVEIAGAPWVLTYRIPTRIITAAATRTIIPELAYLALLGTLVLIGYLAVVRGFIRPSFKLIGTIEALAAGGKPDAQEMPGAWRPWFNRVFEMFDSLKTSLRNEQEAKLTARAVIDVALDGVITADEAGTIIDFNPAAEQLFGVLRSEVAGRKIGDTIVPAKYRKAHEAGISGRLTSQNAHIIGHRIEMEALHATGELFPIELQVHEIDHIQGLRYVAYVRSLKEQKAAEAELATQRERLHQAEKLSAMGSLLAGLAHELNNPLAVIVAHTSLLEELSADKATVARAAKIRSAADRCGRIIRTFLLMARQQAPRSVSVDIPKVVSSALDMLGYSLKSSGVAVNVRYTDTPHIQADPDQLNQILINLLINAQQAFGDATGERVIDIETIRSGDMLQIVVADNGPGIPDAIKSRIFEAFFTTKPVGVGTGVGLAVCSNIAKAHGGALSVADRQGGGTVFTLSLPITTSIRDGAQSELRTPDAGATEPKYALIVDDEIEVAEVLADYLFLEGHRSRIETSVKSGLMALQEEHYEMIFCDLRMPGGGGSAFWREVVDRHPSMADRIVFVTGDMVAGPSHLAAAANGHPVRLLEKPFTREDVRNAIDMVLNDSMTTT